MNIKTITILEADEGKMLKKGDIVTAAVMLQSGETTEGWEEVEINEPEPELEPEDPEQPDEATDSE